LFEGLCLLGLARTASEQGQHARSVRLFAAQQALTEAGRYGLPPRALDAREECLVAAREALGEDAYQSTWEAGRSLTQEEAVALALAEE
jgi:hypothetical protein